MKKTLRKKVLFPWRFRYNTVMAKISSILLMIDTATERGRGLLRGVAKYSRLHGPWSFYRNVPFYIEPEKKAYGLEKLKKLDIDGIIVRKADVGPDLYPVFVEKIAKLGLPTIVAAHQEKILSGVVTFTSDYAMDGKMAAEYFLDRGFRNFAYCGFKNMYWSVARGHSFAHRLARGGYECHLYEKPDQLVGSEQKFLADWLKSLPRPIALMTCNDDRSQQVIEACKASDIHVPEQIAVLGVDNDGLICELCHPPLSSIAHDPIKTGYDIAALLDKMMKGQDVGDQVIIDKPTHVVTRQSTNILAIDDEDVAKAVRFINENSKEPIQVVDVIDAAALSRRAMEKRFKRILGRSIHMEIKRVRVGEITKLLINTQMPISRIAQVLNFPDANKITRYYKEAKGITPLAYRKQYKTS
jgi:LacI family transcriptional regulator, galactose operon repressor